MSRVPYCCVFNFEINCVWHFSRMWLHYIRLMLLQCLSVICLQRSCTWSISCRNYRWPNHPGMARFVLELTHGAGRSSFCLRNVKIDHRAWIYGCSLMSVLYFILCLSVTHDLTWLEYNVTDYNEIVIIRLAANTINNDEMQRAYLFTITR